MASSDVVTRSHGPMHGFTRQGNRCGRNIGTSAIRWQLNKGSRLEAQEAATRLP